MEIATGNGLQPGLRLVQSNFGMVSTRTLQASGDGLTLRDSEGTLETVWQVIPPAQGATLWQRQVTATTNAVVSSSTSESYDLQDGNYVLISNAVDPSTANDDELITYTSYYSDGRVRSVVTADKSWSFYTYSGDSTTTYSPWLSSSSLTVINGIYSLPTTGMGVRTVSSDSSSSSSSSSYLVDFSGAGWDVQMSGSYSSSYSDSAYTHTSRSTGRGDGYVNSYSLAYSDDYADRFLAGRTVMTWDDTGRATLHQYDRGNWAAPVFTPDTNGTCVRTSTSSGYIAAPSSGSTVASFTAVPSHGTKEVTITTALGVVREETHVCNASGGYQFALAKDLEYESSGQFRPTGTKINGIYISKTEYVSPTVTRNWGEDGSMTETETNGEGDVIRSTTSGNATVPAVTTTYDHTGLTSTTAVNGLTVSVETQDRIGRTVSSQDATGTVVDTTYSDEGRTVTRTAPGDVKTVESRYYDGHTISATGSGVIPRFYSYSVDPLTNYIMTTTAVGSQNSPRVTSSTCFWDGSTASESSPDPEGGSEPIVLTYTYAPGSSSLVRVHSTAANTADRIQLDPATSAAAAMGHYSLSGSSTVLTGDPVVASTDRLTETSTSYILVGSVWNQQTVTRVFHTDGTTASYTRTSFQALAPVAVSDATYGSGLRRTSSTSNGTTTVTTNRDSFFTGVASVQSSDDSATSVSPDSTSVSQYGRTVSSSAYGTTAAETMVYDASGRMTRHTSATGANTDYGYNAVGQLGTTTDHEGKTTTYLYHPNNHPNAGLLWKTTNPEAEVTETLYNNRGQLAETTGSGTYRVTRGYNAYGEMDSLLTYRTGAAGDLTQWNYNPATGLLDDKTDAASKKTLYTYYSNGRLKTRQWARPGTVKATYTYNAFGDLTLTDYSDSTLDVTITPDRLGRPVTITDASGTRTQTYQSVTGDLDLVAYSSGGLLPALQIDYTQDSSLRPSGYSVSSGGPASVLGYDTSGRLSTVAASGSTHTHGYMPGTHTLASLTTTSGATTTLARTLYHDRMQRLRGIVTANASGTALSRHGYTLDDAGRRKTATRENGQRWDYGYDTLGQVTSAVKKFPSEVAIPGHTFGYGYDGIGNRTSASHGGTGTAVTYTPNALNQYASVATQGGRFILGEAPAANAVTVNGLTAARAGGLGFYWQQLTASNASAPVWSNDTVVSNGVTLSGRTWTPAAIVAPTYDEDGNLKSDGRWDYLWDAENRLIQMKASAAALAAATASGIPCQKLDFAYDSQGRRVSKTVSTSTNGTTWTFAGNQRFLYDAWNMIAEYSTTQTAPNTLVLQVTHTWGIDLSGSPQGAGGVGGLRSSTLITTNPITSNSCFPAYDGNGNISAWIDGTGTLLGRIDSNANINDSLLKQFLETWTQAFETTYHMDFGLSVMFTDEEKKVRLLK